MVARLVRAILGHWPRQDPRLSHLDDGETRLSFGDDPWDCFGGED